MSISQFLFSLIFIYPSQIFIFLLQCRQDYKSAYVDYLTSPSTETLSSYFNTHNAYVQQLHATNGMLEEYGKETLPQLLQVNCARCV